MSSSRRLGADCSAVVRKRGNARGAQVRRSTTKQRHLWNKKRQMTDNPNIAMTGVALSTAIDLRWTLRDIRAKRTKLTPLNSDHVRTLVEMGLFELRDDQPVLT